MNHRQLRLARGILAAVAVTGVILLLHDRFAPWLGERAPMLPFLFSVLVAAWVGGFWPGLLATGLGGMAGAYMILDPPGSMFPDQPNEWAPLFVFLAAGATISWAFDALIRARDRALESERGWRESEERFRLTADSAPVLIWMSGIDKLCTWFNRGWLDFVGRSLEQEVGNGWTENVHSEDLGRCLEVYTTSFDARREFNLEYRLRRHDGRYRWVLDHGVPRFGTGGEFTGYIGSCVDITERRAAEQARHEAEARILGTFQQADRRKDEFLAVLAHELRNPLAPVRNAAHLMKVNDLSGPELKRPADMIERQVTHMARLIDDLLDVSRIVTGVIDLRLEHVEWSDVVHAAVDACRPDIEARGHALRINLPSVPVHVRADRDRLIQVLNNLISNATKYTPPRGSIDLSTRLDRDVLEFAVRDNGQGIPPDKLSEIFELFVQVERSLERQGGLGIGLTLSRQLMELHGGTLEARSDGVGRGSTFLLKLPIVPAMEVVPSATGRSMAGAAERRRVLVVDDCEDSAESLALILCHAGHDTRVAYDGEAALLAGAEFRPEAAFLDIGLPRMNGYELARRLRETAWGRSVYLVALTGWGQESDQRRATDAGFDAHLLKPADPDVVTGLLANIRERMSAPAG